MFGVFSEAHRKMPYWARQYPTWVEVLYDDGVSLCCRPTWSPFLKLMRRAGGARNILAVSHNSVLFTGRLSSTKSGLVLVRELEIVLLVTTCGLNACDLVIIRFYFIHPFLFGLEIFILVTDLVWFVVCVVVLSVIFVVDKCHFLSVGNGLSWRISGYVSKSAVRHEHCKYVCCYR